MPSQAAEKPRFASGHRFKACGKNLILSGAAVYRCGKSILLIVGFSPAGHALDFSAPCSGMPPRDVECEGFSRCAATGEPRRLEPFRLVALGGIAEALRIFLKLHLVVLNPSPYN
jgi:hypothetical protein